MKLNSRGRNAAGGQSLAALSVLLSLLLCTRVFPVDMKRVAVLDCELYGPLCCGDANHNDFNEILSVRTPGSESLVIFEHIGDNIYNHINTTQYVHYVSAFGDGDGDSLKEIVVQAIPDSTGQRWVQLLESQDYTSFPSRTVWQVPHEYCFYHTLFLDLDRDGRREMAFRFDEDGIRLYENVCNDSYSLVHVFRDYGPTYGDFCADDFDRDGLMELMAGSCYSHYVLIWEATGNDNEYVLNWVDTTETYYNRFTCAPGDMDGDAWPELAVIGEYQGWAKMIIYEASANNQYHRVWEHLMTGGGEMRMVGGDVDGDQIPELAVMTAGGVFLFKAAGQDSYRQIWQLTDSAVGSMNVYDVNGNGRAEIIMDLPGHVSIYEDCSPGVAEFAPHAAIAPVEAPSIVRSPFRFEHLPPQSDIELYSVDGQLVVRQQVSHSPCWLWDLRDQNGRQVPAGTYLAVIRSKNQTQQLKLCVVR